MFQLHAEQSDLGLLNFKIGVITSSLKNRSWALIPIRVYSGSNSSDKIRTTLTLTNFPVMKIFNDVRDCAIVINLKKSHQVTQTQPKTSFRLISLDKIRSNLTLPGSQIKKNPRKSSKERETGDLQHSIWKCKFLPIDSTFGSGHTVQKQAVLEACKKTFDVPHSTAFCQSTYLALLFSSEFCFFSTHVRPSHFPHFLLIKAGHRSIANVETSSRLA